jgi:multidrug efflux system membrane fusion protein
VFPGSSVKLNDTALALINRIRPLHIAFAVPGKAPAAPARRPRQAGKFTAQIAVAGDWSPVTEAAVNFIDNTVDVGTGTIQIKASATE